MAKIIAIISGGDWADASCEHLTIPDDYDLAEAKKQYRAWYNKTQAYITFSEWLLSHGAQSATEEEVEEIYPEGLYKPWEVKDDG